MRFLKWKNRSLTRGLFSAGGRVLVLLLCLCFALSSYLPVSAYTLSSTTKRQITGVTYSTPNQSISDVIYNNSNSAVKFIIGNTGASLWSTSNVYLTINVSIPANSIASVSMSVSGANTGSAPQCFSGDGRQQVIDCDINGDNGNYTVSALFYITTATSTLNLYSYTPNQNLGMGNGIVVDIGPVVTSTVNAEGLSSQDITDIKFRLTQIDQWTFDSAVRLETIIPMLQDIIDGQGDTSDKLDREWQQGQDDRDDLTDQQQDISDDADDSAQQAETAGTTLLGAFSSFVGALTNASPTNCVIDMDMGNLDLGEVDLCQLSPPQPIPTIASIMLIAFCVPLSLATATKMINLFRSFTG